MVLILSDRGFVVGETESGGIVDGIGTNRRPLLILMLLFLYM